MNIPSGKLRQSIVLILITSISVALVVVYFFIYVKDKEDYVNKRNFKELTKSAQNIKRKVLVYTTIGITKNFLQYNLDYLLKEPRRVDKSDRVNARLYQELRHEIETGTMKLSINSLTPVQIGAGEKDRTWTYQKNSPAQNFELRFTNDSSEFLFRDTLQACLRNGMIGPCDSLRAPPRIDYIVESSIPVDEFIKPLLQDDIFDAYVLMSSRSNGNSILFESRSLGPADSLNAVLKSFKSEVRINGNDFKIFPYKFLVQRNYWVLIGLQHEEEYLAETRNFDRPVLYLIIIIALILLLSLPWIKVVLISKNEKLNRTDVTLCGVSLLLGCFLWTVIIISLDYAGLYKVDDQGRNHLEELASKIENRLEDEIKAGYAKLKKADENFIPRDIQHISHIDSISRKLNDGPASETPDTTFDFICWIGSSGKQKYKWSTEKKSTRKIDVSNRDYFKKAIEKDLWPLNEKGDSIAFESIRSWNNAGERGVISIPTKKGNLGVAVIQCKLPSVIDCVLSPGYKFCIADQTGTVWFHSNPDKNLNENIFEECDIKYDVRNILYSKEKVSTVIYENKKHELYIKPLKQLPLFLITMKELSVEAQSMAYVMEVTFALMLGHALFILLTIVIIWITWRRSLRRFSVRRSSDWLKPDEEKTREYIKISLLNFAIAILFLPFFHPVFNRQPTAEIFAFVLTPLYILPVYYLFLNNQKITDFLRPLNRVLIYSMAFLILIVNGVLVGISADIHVFAYQVVLILLIALWLYIAHNSARVIAMTSLDSVRKFLKEISLRTSYSLAISSLFLVIAIIPVFEFHRKAFNLERVKYLMTLQYETAKESLSKSQSARLYCVDDMDTVLVNWAQLGATNRQVDKLSTLMGPLLDVSGTSFIKRGGNWHAFVEDSPWKWSEKDDFLYFTRASIEPAENQKSLRSPVQRYNFPGFPVWISGMIGIVYLFLFSRYLVTRIFIFDVNRNLVEADMFLITTAGQPAKPLPKNHLFIIGLPFSGKRDYIDKLYPQGSDKRHTIDLVEIEPKSNLPDVGQLEMFEVIVIDHFEFDFLNVKHNKQKLLLLEHLFLKWSKKIVVLSTIHTTQLLEQCREDHVLTARWQAVLSHFYAIFYPLQKVQLSKQAIMKEFDIEEDTWKQNRHYYEFIEKECNHGLFLQNLRPTMYSLVDIANKDHLTLEELSEKVKSLAYTYYASIWSTCSKDERFLIYDLAEDGLVNVKNAPSIIHLIYKGVFYQKRTLSIMNRSFRNFVLTYVTPEEVRAMRKETLNYGTWSSVKGPILLVLAIGLLFLLYTQKGLANEIMAFLGALIAAIPVFLRSLASVDQPSKPKIQR